MEYAYLGRTGLQVSRLCLGTMNFGPLTNEVDSYAIMDKALELGINFFDTANVYGWKTGEGVTEQIVGRGFAQGGGRGEEVGRAREGLARQGKVIYFGSSNFAGWHIVQANEAAKARHFMGLVSEQ